MAALRHIGVEALGGPLDVLAQLRLTEEELESRRISFDIEGWWWDGLGDFSGCYLELETGEQFLFRRFGHEAATGRVDVLGRIELDPDSQIASLLDALDLERERILWTVAPETWRELQTLLDQYRRNEPPG